MKKFFTLLFVMVLAGTSAFAVDMTVTGSFPDNTWNNANAGYLMTEIGTTGVYMLEKTLPAGTYEFKVFFTGTWNGAPGSGDNRVISLDAEKTVKFYAKNDGGTIRFYSDAQQLYVIGAAVGGWDASNMKAMTATATETAYTADVVAGAFKIVSKDKNNSIVWDDITPSDQTVAGSGNYTIKLDFATFAVSSTSNGEVTPSLESLSDSYLFVGATPETATWYNANATFQAESFNGKNLGSVTTSILLGGEIKTSPVLDGVTVKLHYQIDDQAVSFVEIPWVSNADGKSTWKSTAGTNVFSGATLVRGNSYSLKVWFSATDGTSTLWDSNNMANYVASFTYDVGTSVDNVTGKNIVTAESGRIMASFDGTAKVQLYSFTGQLMHAALVESKYEISAKSGVYLLNINGESYKVIVR